MEDLTCEPVEPMSRSAVVHALKSGDPGQIAQALYSSTYHDPDWRWVQGECLRFLTHEERTVRWAAATCLGDLAMFHKILDLELVLPALQEALKDEAIHDVVELSLSFIKQ